MEVIATTLKSFDGKTGELRFVSPPPHDKEVIEIIFKNHPYKELAQFKIGKKYQISFEIKE